MSITTINSSQTSEQARDAAIKQAANHLSKGAIENLWETEVSNAAWYKKGLGLFNYAWKKYQAYSAAKEFNHAAVELVRAVAERYHTKAEAESYECPKLVFSDQKLQEKYINGKILADKALENFYKAFKNRITSLNIEDKNLQTFISATQQILSNLSKSEVLPANTTRITLESKIETTMQCFQEHIFKDMIESYSSQSIEKITVKSYEETVKTLKSCFPLLERAYIREVINRAILGKHNADTLEDIVEDCTNPSENSPRLLALQKKIGEDLAKEKSKLDTELQQLRGTGFDGTLNTAFKAMDTAKKENDKARTDYLTARYNYGIACYDMGSDDDLLALEDTPPEIVTLKNDFREKCRTFKQNNETYKKLDTRFKEIAQFNDGSSEPNGGRLFEVNEGLKKERIIQAARHELRESAKLYNYIKATNAPTRIIPIPRDETIETYHRRPIRRSTSF